MGAGTRGFVLLGFLAIFDSCEVQGCTEMACSDGAVLTLRRPDGTLATGAYTLRFTVAGQVHACDFTVPDDLPTNPGQIGNPACDTPSIPAVTPFSLSVLPEMACTETRTQDAISQSCTPVPDHWYFSAVLQGTPSDVSVVVERDGVELMTDQHTFAYRNDHPNGPECGPVCRRSGAELILPD